MDTRFFDELPSTQLYILEQIKSGKVTKSTAVLARNQTAGIGSRNNNWSGGEGNFFASIAICASEIPADIPSTSLSIYYAYLMKRALGETEQKVWLKWPNDLYKDKQKIGGVISKKISEFIVVGIGVNLKKNQNSYSSLDTDISPLILLNIFLSEVEKKPKWKEVFSQYKIEFDLSKSYFTHQNGLKIDMKNAKLCSDGSLDIGGGKVYSLR